MTLPSGTRLGPYEILSPLGAGGMGEVYRARDRKLDRDVAVKVLPQSLSADADALARFEREAKSVAALSHPNILSIHDFGTHEGTAYAVMELLEGETLRGKLDSGPIAQKQAVDYALQVARGLSAAHEKGIVHRDLKPENLFVSKDGHVKILDFGLAKKTEVAGPEEQTSAPTGSGHTEPGTVMGTAGYMSPEQVRGLPVDHRSDIFSFGAVLYELLSGRKAFKRDTAIDTMTAIVRDDPPELSESGRNFPVALDRVVKHCLEKDRDNRFQSAKDVAFALSEASGPSPVPSGPQPIAPAARRIRTLLVAAVLVLVAVAGGLAFWGSRRGGRGGSVRRVAVLPFENLGLPEDDYFTDGISDEVRAKLTALPGLQVIARASSTPYKKTTKKPREVAEELEADYLLTATVRWEKSGPTSRVHVTPELVEVSGSGPPSARWQQTFDAALTDVFSVQSDIASKVAQALGVALGASDVMRLSEKPTENLAAYDAFLKGEDASNGLGVSDPPSLRRALAFYEQAVALDPGFAQAWARVSLTAAILYGNSAPTPELAERARLAAETSARLAPGRPEGYWALGTYQRLIARDRNRAMEQFAKGQRLAPTDVNLLAAVAIVDESLGLWDAALEHFGEAQRLDPRSVASQRRFADALARLRRYREAREAFANALVLAPTNLGLIESIAMTHLGEGDLGAARKVVASPPAGVTPEAFVAYLANYQDLAWLLDEPQRQLLLRLPPEAFDGDKGAWAMCRTQVYALAGDFPNMRAAAEQARKEFDEQLRSSRGDNQRLTLLGLALAFLGRKEDAIAAGRRAAEAEPLTLESVRGPYFQHQLVRIYILVGEPEKALDQLEPLLRVPYWLSPAWLRIDPNFDPLRKSPRFQKLVAGR